jgi:hypothetical protein
VQVWDALGAFTASVRDVWFEHADVVAGVLTFRRVRCLAHVLTAQC